MRGSERVRGEGVRGGEGRGERGGRRRGGEGERGREGEREKGGICIVMLHIYFDKFCVIHHCSFKLINHLIYYVSAI